MSTLIDELRKPLYTGMTDAEAAVALDAVDKTEVFSRFGSYRTLAHLLSEAEYNALASAIDAASAHSRLMADMAKMLSLPGDEWGNGGGIDFGDEATRGVLDSLLLAIAQALGGDGAEARAAALIAKLKGYAERITNTATMLDLRSVSENDVHNARN